MVRPFLFSSEVEAMAVDRLVRLPCDIYLGGFSSERGFRIVLPEGEYVSAAPVEYFWADQQHRLGADQPRQRETAMPGYVDARVVAKRPDGRLLMSLPSGDVLEVGAAMIVDYPREATADVSVQP